MSLGFGGVARKVLEDAECVIYEYLAYNWNEPRFSNREWIFDGIILISKSCLAKLEPCGNIRRLLRKKRGHLNIKIPLEEFIYSGEVQIENCSNAWEFMLDGVDVIAHELCWILFLKYQLSGEIPERLGYQV